MTVAYDATSKMSAVARGPSNPQTHSWTHTPSGTPAGIWLCIVSGASGVTAADNLIESATYGGVSMTEVGETYLASGERGCAIHFELLSGVPSGAQTVAFSARGFPTSSTAAYPWLAAHAVSLTAGGTIARADSDVINNTSLMDPSVTMDAGSNTGISLLGGYSALANLAAITAATGCTTTSDLAYVLATHGEDAMSVAIRQTSPATGTFAIGYTGAADDVAMVAATYYEAAAAGTATPGMRSLRSARNLRRSA